jgi:hypothetical protein
VNRDDWASNFSSCSYRDGGLFVPASWPRGANRDVDTKEGPKWIDNPPVWMPLPSPDPETRAAAEGFVIPHGSDLGDELYAASRSRGRDHPFYPLHRFLCRRYTEGRPLGLAQLMALEQHIRSRSCPTPTPTPSTGAQPVGESSAAPG